MTKLTKASSSDDVKQEWVRRLESGELKQIEGWLGKKFPDGSEGFCCLGVLTEMAVEAGIGTRRKLSGVHGAFKYDFPSARYEHMVDLAMEVCDWAGLPHLDPETTVENEEGEEDDMPYKTLAGLNDGGWTFREIAEQIRKDFL